MIWTWWIFHISGLMHTIILGISTGRIPVGIALISFFSSKRLNHQVVVSKFGKPVNPWFLNQAVAAAGATGSYVARLSLTGDPMIWWFLGEWCQVDPSIHFFFLISETVWDLASCDFFRLRIFSPSKMRMLCVVKKTPRSLGWAWNLTHPMGFWLRRQT